MLISGVSFIGSAGAERKQFIQTVYRLTLVQPATKSGHPVRFPYRIHANKRNICQSYEASGSALIDSSYNTAILSSK